MTNEGDSLFHFLLGESKKRLYIATWDNNNKITGLKVFRKKEDEGYFLRYNNEKGEDKH